MTVDTFCVIPLSVSNATQCIILYKVVICAICVTIPVSCESGYWKFEKWKVKNKSLSHFPRSEKWNGNMIHSFREVKSEMKIWFILFENDKWNGNALKSRSRMKSELKMLRDRDREVKFLENSREILENQRTKKILKSSLPFHPPIGFECIVVLPPSVMTFLFCILQFALHAIF